MSRVVLHHLTPVGRLPAIEVEGLRTRADLSGLLGPVDAFDEAAPGTFARGKRVTGWLSREHALTQVGALGRGLVSYSVDPARTLAQPASAREADPASAWALARPLSVWLAEGTPPGDLEVHLNLPVRAKHVRIHAPLADDAALGDWAPLVAAIADADRVAAKLVMHMAIAASEADTEGRDFLAACALAWRDEPDGDDLMRRVGLADAEAVLTAVLAEHRAAAPALVARLTVALDDMRMAVSDEDGDGDIGDELLERTGAVLARLA
jgi:hypothetical protein